MAIQLKHTPQLIKSRLQLPASKSESNRALIIQALSSGLRVKNISSARDTQTMQRLLQSSDYELDVLDAGTTMRFLTAYCALSGRPCRLTGTARMQERPIGLLVEALNRLGAQIRYERREGYPPLLIDADFEQQTNALTIPSNISSQYISALLLVAPLLPQGLHLSLEGEISSRPYIEMTLALMQHFGARYQWQENTIEVEPGGYAPGGEYTVEGDWSAASYWFSTVALTEKAEIMLPHLRRNSLQGDRAIVAIMEPLGVASHWTNDGLLLSKQKPSTKELVQDFTHCPDLAQTVAVCCAAAGIRGRFSGLHSLRIKETDRIAALQIELGKLGARLSEESTNQWLLEPAPHLPPRVSISTYDDHRMAMAFAPLATKMQVEIEDPGVVAKSYPHFWEDVAQCGIATEAI